MKIRSATIPAALLFQFVFLGSLAHAAVISDSSATLDLDWGSLGSSVVWGGDGYNFNGSDANLDGVTDSEYRGDEGPATAQVTADAVGTAHTTFTSATATAHARADGIGITSPPDEDVSASGTSHRGRYFSPTEDGQITFSFEYTISQSFSKELPEEGHSAWSKAELVLRRANNDIGYDSAILNNAGTTQSGFLSFPVDLLASEGYYIEGHVYTSSTARSPEQEAVIPEPGSIVIWALGLLLLFRWYRKGT